MLSPQEELDRLFGTSPSEREDLAKGRVSRRLRAYARATSTKDLGAIRIVLIGVLLVLLIARAAPDSEYAVILRTTGAVVAGALGVIWTFVRLREWFHRSRVWKGHGRVRIVEGEARTTREWNHAYGHDYELWTDVHIESALSGGDAPQTERLAAYTRLKNHVVTGPVRAYLHVIPSLEPYISPYREDLVALELLGGATCEARRPSLPPPSKANLVGIPADE